MLNKATFHNDDELNQFFRENIDKSGKSTFFLVKFVVSYNPFERKREYHVVYSTDGIMAGTEHLRQNGVAKK